MARKGAVYSRLARSLPEAENLGGSRAASGGVEEGGKGERDGKKRRGGRSGRRNVNPVAVVWRGTNRGVGGRGGTMLKFPIF